MFAEGVKSKPAAAGGDKFKAAKNAAEGSEKHFGTERQPDERNCGERNAGKNRTPAKT